MTEQDKKRLEVTNIIEPVLLTKLHIGNVGRSGISGMNNLVGMVCIDYKLNPKDIKDFKVAIKIIEDCVYRN